MLTSRRNPSHATMTGMGSLDEELSAMLQTGPHSHGQTSLASVLASTSSPNTADRSRGGDLFSSQFSSLQGGFGGGNNNHQGGQLASSRNMNMQPKGVDSSTPNMPSSFGRGLSNNPNLMSQQQQQQQAPRWPFANDEKWVIDAKNEALEASSLRSNLSNFGTTIDAPTQGLNPPISGAGAGGGLQRYHSAPSSFLQCLADFNEDAFSQVSSPLRDKDGLLNSFFADNLTPIIECAPQQMDTEKPVTSSSLNDYEQFLASQNDFNSRSRNSGKPEPRSLARSDGLGPASIGDRSAAVFDSLGVRPRQMKNNLIRQSSSPADLLAAIQDSMDESDPSMPIPAMMSPDESLSGGTSEDNPTGNHSAKSMMYSRDDNFLATDTVVSGGGLWNNPTSPGHLGGKRLRVPGDSMTESGLPSDLSPKMRVGEPGSLTRHMSLPIPSRPLSPTMDMGLDDLADFSVPCKTRAKRGFATHPRSIAERVRRTRISERMKKLQDLVPNMDRQTNTADMLDEAVEYVKHLQLQVQELSNTVKELKAKC